MSELADDAIRDWGSEACEVCHRPLPSSADTLCGRCKRQEKAKAKFEPPPTPPQATKEELDALNAILKMLLPFDRNTQERLLKCAAIMLVGVSAACEKRAETIEQEAKS